MMMPPIVAPVINLKVILPELVMVITALVVLLFDLVLSKDKKSLLGYVSLLGLAISLIVSIGMLHSL
jgi:NADH:ubiquinone oxidoreductase subunit 2 (subunit N)